MLEFENHLKIFKGNNLSHLICVKDFSEFKTLLSQYKEDFIIRF